MYNLTSSWCRLIMLANTIRPHAIWAFEVLLIGTKYLEEVYMSLSVTDLAVTKLKEYLSQNNIDSALRVALMQGG